MGRRLRAALSALFLLSWLVSCGPSGSEPAAGGGMQAMPARKPPPAQKPKTPPDPEAAQQQLLSLVVWDSSEAERDRKADSDASSEEVNAAAPDAKRGVHPLVGVQRWIQCMEGFGWSQKKKS